MAVEDGRPAILVLSFLAFGLSFPIMIAGGRLGTKSATYCFPHYSWWFLALGLALSLVSLLGMISTYQRYSWGLLSYLAMKLKLLVILLCILVISFTTLRSNDESSVMISGAIKHVGNSHRWNEVVACLKKTKICESDGGYAGCCLQPSKCEHVAGNSSNIDCPLWSPNVNRLCYYCNSCKAAVFLIFESKWRGAKITLIVSITLVGVLLGIEVCFCWYAWEQILRVKNQGQPQDQQG